MINKVKKYIFQNTPNNDSNIGVEIEHLILDKNNNSVLYFKKNNKDYYGINNILKDLSSKYNTIKYVDPNTKGLIFEISNNNTKISVEPGGQIEFACKKTDSVNEFIYLYKQFLSNINKILNKHKYKIAYLGCRHDLCADEVPIVPRNRYICMDAYFKNIGSMGHIMMRNTCSVQVSIDFADENDCYKKLKIASCLSPIIYFLYDNSPIFEKSQVGKNKTSVSNISIPKKMARYKIWQNTDKDRTIANKYLFSKNFSFDKYIEQMLQIPLIFSPSTMQNLNNKNAVKCSGNNFYPTLSAYDILKNKNNVTNSEINQILSFIFYDVRLKNYIELRAADDMPEKYLYSYITLIKLLFYNTDNLNFLWNIFKNTSYKEYKNCFSELYKNGWGSTIYGENAHKLINKIIKIAIEKCNKQELKNLYPTVKMLIDKVTLKDRLQSEYYKNIVNSNFEFNVKKQSYKPVSLPYQRTKWQKKYFLENSGCLENKKERYKKHLKSKALFQNKVVDTAYFTRIYDQTFMLTFEATSQIFSNILNKIYNEYFTNKEYANLWHWDKFSKKLINFKPKYDIYNPIYRIDIFSDEQNRNFKLCEFNTGGSAAQSEVTYLDNDSFYSEPFKQLIINKKLKLETWDLYYSWVNKFIKIYNNWATNTNNKIAIKNNKDFCIAIVDYLEEGHITDFKLFKQAFINSGYNCIIYDIRKLKYKNKHLTTKDGQIINAVYKRATLNDLLNFKKNKGTKALINSVLNNDLCSIDWYHTQIIHDKQINYILHLKQTKKLLSKAEIEFLKLHVPKSKLIDKKITNNKKYIKNKNNYIIKPLNERRSKNIFSGRDMLNKQWISTLKECSKTKDYIIQEFVEQYKSPNILISVDNKKEFISQNFNKQIKQFSNMNCLYCYNNKLQGVWLRQGDHSKSSTSYKVTCATFYEKNNE